MYRNNFIYKCKSDRKINFSKMSDLLTILNKMKKNGKLKFKKTKIKLGKKWIYKENKLRRSEIWWVETQWLKLINFLIR